MRGRRLARWDGPKHPEHDRLVALIERCGQVWEDSDGWIFFVVGRPMIVTYEENGRPFHYEQPVYVIDDDARLADWHLFETNDRPLEVNPQFTRLA